jgi:hypothetical protein
MPLNRRPSWLVPPPRGARLWFHEKDLLTSIEGKTPAEGGMPANVTRFDGVRVPATDYRPVWLDNLASNITTMGSAMNGVVQGAEAVRPS